MKLTLILTALLVALIVTPASATYVDLTYATGNPCLDPSNNAACLINGAYFNETTAQSTGTGVFDPFLRLQQNGNEQGVNSDGGAGALAYAYDEKTDPHTHSLTFGNLSSWNIFGSTYYKFSLDIFESQGAPDNLLLLNELQIYTSASSGLRTLAQLAGATLRYDMDGLAESGVQLNADLQPGNGAGDMIVYIPTSFFTGALASNYVYLYSQFGLLTGSPFAADSGYTSNSSFEEWANVSGGGGGGNSVPEPSQYVGMLLVGLPVLVGYMRKRRAAQSV